MMKTSPVFQKHEKERKPLSLIIFKQLDSQIPINNNVDIPVLMGSLLQFVTRGGQLCAMCLKTQESLGSLTEHKRG